MNCGENDWWWFWRKKKGKCARSLGYIVRAMGSGSTFFFIMNIFEVIDKTKNFRLTQTSGDDLINYWISYYGYHLVSVCLKKKKIYLTSHSEWLTNSTMYVFTFQKHFSLLNASHSFSESTILSESSLQFGGKHFVTFNTPTRNNCYCNHFNKGRFSRQ